MSKETPTPAPALTLPALGAVPVNLDAHNADKARRQAEREVKEPVLLNCLDPSEAKRYEDRKPLYEWRVQVGLFRPAKGRAPAYTEKFDREVTAQHEADAWAFFCDAIEEWPSYRKVKPKFTRLRRRSLHGKTDPDVSDED